jgi:hypothetical protein
MKNWPQNMGCCADDCRKGFIEAAGSEKSRLIFADSPLVVL